METYKLIKDDRLFAFEIENSYIGLRKITELLNKVDEVSDIKVRRLFSSVSDVHIRFKYNNIDFIVWEPFGDNGRYWIGPEKDSVILNISSLEQVFYKYKVPFLIKIFGDLITFNFKNLFNT